MDKKKKRRTALQTNRRLVQVYAAVLYNAHLKGFAEGRIYSGALKNVCVPGLNCYSCPGAVGACPLGSLQNALSSASKGPLFYVVGLLLLFGLVLGRVVCGWACPVGLLQELIFKLPVPKLKKGRVTRALTAVKYAVLGVFALGFPIAYAFRNEPLPAFCKYICPAGTLEGGLTLLLHPENGGLRETAGVLFFWKLGLALAILIASAFVFRVFCRFLCPLGALYSLFARLALLGVKVDETGCTGCGVCVRVCPVDIRRVGDRECVHCGRCVSACPEQAIAFRAGKITLRGKMNDER